MTCAEGRTLEPAELEQRYMHFSALVHFLDPSKDEEEMPLNLHLEYYTRAVRALEETSDFSIESLSELLRDVPETIDILELILQNSNFTTAQRTFLMFDLQRLNSSSIEDALTYVLEVLCEDVMIRQAFEKKDLVNSANDSNLAQMDDVQKRVFLAESKRLIAGLCDRKNTALLRDRMRVSETARRRAADYFIRKRAMAKVLAGIHPRAFLENKRVPVDPKSAHGKYAAEMLESIILAGGFRRREDLGQQVPRTASPQRFSDGSSDLFSYCREREVESSSSPGVSISSESATTSRKTAKRFDFVLLYGNSPGVVIETNFYTTSGTKIGINEREYLALHQKLEQTETDLRFIWLTDGSYWLTSSGRNDFSKLIPAFGPDLLNLGMFAEELPAIKHSMEKGKTR